MTMEQRYLVNIVFSVLLSASTVVLADSVDRDWEQRTSEKLAKEVGSSEEVLWLKANDTDFLALYMDQQVSELARGAAIILHAMGAHADWPQTIAPLRTGLAEHGWTNLSIQLPTIAPENQIEDYGKTLEQATARIEAAIQLLRDRKFLNITVIGHGFGGVTMLDYLSKSQEPKVVSMVAIGLQDYAFVKPPIDVLGLIEKSKIPVLDIYGSRDFGGVIRQAADRRLAAKKGNNRKYTQFEIEGADHYFTKMEDMLVKRIRGWLDKVAPGGLYILLQEGKTDNSAIEP